MAKLTNEQVRKVLAEWKPGKTEQLGARYGVSVSTIEAIIKGKTWKQVSRERIETGGCLEASTAARY